MSSGRDNDEFNEEDFGPQQLVVKIEKAKATVISDDETTRTRNGNGEEAIKKEG